MTIPTKFWSENLKGGDKLGGLCKDGSIILKLTDPEEIRYKIHPAQDGDQWRTLMNVVTPLTAKANRGRHDNIVK
jgi:hypothetical protein